jgi:hypothetical protein
MPGSGFCIFMYPGPDLVLERSGSFLVALDLLCKNEPNLASPVPRILIRTCRSESRSKFECNR